MKFIANLHPMKRMASTNEIEQARFPPVSAGRGHIPIFIEDGQNEIFADSNRGAIMDRRTGEVENSPSQINGEADSGGAPDFGYSMPAGLMARLRSLDIGLAVASYQSGLSYLLGRNLGTDGLNVRRRSAGQ